jgi:hypothetical protein
MRPAVAYVAFLIIGVGLGVSVGVFVLPPRTTTLNDPVLVTIQEISCSFAEHTIMELALQNNVPERSLKGNATLYQGSQQWTSEVRWYFTGDGLVEIVCDSINETESFRVKYVEASTQAVCLDRIIEWDEVGRVEDFTFMKTEELKITAMTFQTGNATIYVTNTGADSLTVSSVTIDDAPAGTPTWGGSFTGGTLAKGASGTITVNHAWTSGNKYTYAVLTTQGNKYTYTATATP